MKRIVTILSVIAVLATFGLFAVGSSEDEVVDQGTSTNDSQAIGNAVQDDPTTLGDYQVDIKSYRLAKDYEGKDVIIVTYVFTNVKSENAASFMTAIEDNAFQNGVGLNKAFILDDSAAYSEDNQTKEIKAGASLDVEVAYELNDTASDVVVEVNEWISFNDKTLTKTFTIA